MPLTAQKLAAPPARSTADAQTLTLNRAIKLALSDLAALQKMYRDGVNLIWKNPYGLSPQDAVAALGKNAADAFARINDLATAINNESPGGANFTPPMTVTINADGTVTLTPIAAAPPSAA